MVAMAAIVAQNGATGQSLVEQFTTGNLNPFIGGYAKQVRRGKELKLARFLFLQFFGLTWIFHMMEKTSKGFLAKCIRIYITTLWATVSNI